MANKLNYDGKAILNVKFSPKQKGYDPLEVDQVFDKIIEDYGTLQATIYELTLSDEKKQAKLVQIKKELDSISLELASTKKQLDLLKKTSKITDDNYKLIMKVNAYEKVLHRKGIDLKKAISDPDNC